MKICAEVVTHNRLAGLQRIVEALRTQSRRPDGILVVDNASTDGTAEWLAGQADLHVLRQGNLGSGGGQRAGIEWACAQGYAAVWCFDDDALPQPQALEALCAALDLAAQPAVFNCTVVAPNGRDLSFGLADLSQPHAPVVLRTYAEVAAHAGPFASWANFFNGTLLPCVVVERVGLPRAELFIRGDEVEYSLRILRAGFQELSVPASRVVHPPEVATVRRLLGRPRARPLLPAWKAYYAWRNTLELNDGYDVIYPDRAVGWRRLVLTLLWEWGFWYRFARPHGRALRLALGDWRRGQFRRPDELRQLG